MISGQLVVRVLAAKLGQSKTRMMAVVRVTCLSVGNDQTSQVQNSFARAASG